MGIFFFLSPSREDFPCLKVYGRLNFLFPFESSQNEWIKSLLKHSFSKPKPFKINVLFSFLSIRFYIKLYILERVKSLLKKLSLVLTVTLWQRLFYYIISPGLTSPPKCHKKTDNIWYFMPSMDITYLDQSLAEQLLWESYYGRVTVLLWKTFRYFQRHLSIHSAFKKGEWQRATVSLFQRKINHGTLSLWNHCFSHFQVNV